MSFYENLAQGIILHAVMEWRSAVKKLKKHPESESAIQNKKESEQFFLSDWFYELSGLDGALILKKLEEEE